MIAFVLFAACITVGVHSAQQQCGQNEVFAQCHNQFPPTCVDKTPAGFPVPCKPGCNCANGYIRKDASATATCVPVNQCSGGVKCGPNEVFKSCPTPTQCAKTCQNFQGTTPAPACNTPCAAFGCECQSGFVRQQNGNVCIKQTDCAFVTGSPSASSAVTGNPQASTPAGTSGQCKTNEVFAQCHNQFPPTCAEKSPSAFPVPCKPGCNCANGYIRKDSSATALCIPVNQCGSAGITCGPNEISKSCPTPATCAKTCANFHLPSLPKCNVPCPSTGCECKPGFVRQQNSNVCIREQDCAFVTTQAGAASTPAPGGSTGQPLKCGANEVLKKKSDCPKTPACEGQCVQGVSKPSKCNTCNPQQRCECQSGYLRQMDHGQKICISTDDCAFNKGT